MRKFAALVLTLALANYGVMATASAHAHEHTGFHQVHAGFDGDHDRNDHHGETESNTELPAPEHSESGLHSHSTPQFGQADPGIVLVVALTTDRTNSPDPDRFVPLHQDSPPFKPPRIRL